MSRRRVGEARRPRHGKGIAEESAVDDTIAAFAEVQQAYQDALVKLWAVPPEELVQQTAVVLGKLLDYQHAFKIILATDAYVIQQSLEKSRDREEAEAFFQLLLQKLVQTAKVEEEHRADRVVVVALCRTGRKPSSPESQEWTH